MNTEWDLSSLEGNFEEKREEIENKVEEFINKWKNDPEYLKNPEVLKTALDEYEFLDENHLKGGDEYYFYWLKVQLDESNPGLKAKFNKANEFRKNIENKLRFFELNISKIPEEKQKEFLQDLSLKEYKHFLETLFENGKYFLSEKEEKILSLKSSSAYSFWVDMLSGFLSKEEEIVLDENLKETKKSFSSIMSLINNSNKEVRNKASEALVKILEKYEDVAENELNAVLENKKINDELRGFVRPDKSRHIQDDIKTEIIDSLIEIVSSKGFEISKRFYEFKLKLMKVKKFNYSERSLAYGKVSKEFDYENSLKIVKKVFLNLDKKFYEILKKFIEKKQIDVFPKKGKESGAFCIALLKRQPIFVLLNHTDELKDVLTIAHEVGHSIHKELMREKNNSLNIGAPKSTAEVASIFMEDFVLQELLKGSNKEEKLILMMEKLQDDIQTVTRQIACYKFEQELHKEFKIKGYLSKKEIGNLFKKHMKNYLGDVFKEGRDMEIGWVYWSHIRTYFYVYSYASGLLISKALQNLVKEDPKNIEKVKEFMSAGTSKSPMEIFKDIGIDISNKEIWNKGLKEVEDLLNKAEELAKKLGKI